MKTSVQETMRQAMQLTRAGRLAEATAVIQRALDRNLFSHPHEPAPHPARGDAGSATYAASPAPVALIDLHPAVNAVEDEGPADAAVPGPTVIEFPPTRERHPGDPARRQAPSAPALREGGFSTGSHTHAGLTRSYKVFVPPGASGGLLPLVVMLHGCTQDPDDFAAGTDMNRLAVELGLCVLYPAQAQQANPSKCWNWFKHNHQGDRGEPALIASMTRAVMNERGIDPQRVYIAGLSAGGAMAAAVAAAYPDLFAAVGVHSGLAPGVARSLPEALSAMQGAPSTNMARTAASKGMPGLAVPVIVFHGDADRTVHPRNGQEIVASALRSSGAPETTRGCSAQGQAFTRHVHKAGTGQPAVEHWILHGAGHAWAGGSASGSFTDPAGPDASREMLRFFFENPRVALQ